MATSVWTIGHSTRPLDVFLALLDAHDIETVADVRRFPGSRRWPQFSRNGLSQVLEAHRIDYQWLPELGGRRRPLPDSRNAGWRSAAFRGYADHMETAEFADGLTSLLNLALGSRVAIMCAEAVWWRCHRGLIADVLRWLGFDVWHIMSADRAVPHPYTRAARIVRGRLSYAAGSTNGKSSAKSPGPTP
jgi:uncharacterized protein (DUF488 family)